MRSTKVTSSVFFLHIHSYLIGFQSMDDGVQKRGTFFSFWCLKIKMRQSHILFMWFVQVLNQYGLKLQFHKLKFSVCYLIHLV